MYVEAGSTAEARGGVAPRCACARPAPIPIVSRARLVAAPMVAKKVALPLIARAKTLARITINS